MSNPSKRPTEKSIILLDILGGFYTRKRKLHGRLEIRNFSSCVENISLVCSTFSYNIFQHPKRNFVSLSDLVISSISTLLIHRFAWYSRGEWLFQNTAQHNNSLQKQIKSKFIGVRVTKTWTSTSEPFYIINNIIIQQMTKRLHLTWTKIEFFKP